MLRVTTSGAATDQGPSDRQPHRACGNAPAIAIGDEFCIIAHRIEGGISARIQILIAMEIKRFDLVATLFDANALAVSALEAITIVEGDFESNCKSSASPSNRVANLTVSWPPDLREPALPLAAK